MIACRGALCLTVSIGRSFETQNPGHDIARGGRSVRPACASLCLSLLFALKSLLRLPSGIADYVSFFLTRSDFLWPREQSGLLSLLAPPLFKLPNSPHGRKREVTEAAAARGKGETGREAR